MKNGMAISVYLLVKMKNALNSVVYVRNGSKHTINATAPANAIPMGTPLSKNPNKEQYAEKAEELKESLLEWLKKNKSKHYRGVKEREII